MSKQEEASVGSKLKEAGRHSIVYGFGSVAQSAVQFLLIPILTGLLTRDDYGAYSIILMVSTVAGVIFFLGMTSAMPRSYYDYEAEEDRRAVFTTAFLILLLGAFVQMVLGVVAGRMISMVFLHSERHAIPIAWAFLTSALAFINQYLFTYLRFTRKSIVAVLFSLISLVGSIGLSILLLHWMPASLSAPFQASALTQLMIAGLFMALFGRKAFCLRIKREGVRLLLSYGIGTVIASFATMLLDWADRVLIDRFVSIGDVGLYSAGYRLGSLVNVLLILPFAQIWSPMMMEYRSHSNIKSLYSRIFFYFILIGAIILIGASLFLGDLLPHLIRSIPRDAMGSVLPIIMLVMLGYFWNGTTNILSAGLIYERKVSVFVYVYYAVAVLKIIANVIIIPRFGTLGAAWTTAGAYLLIPAIIYLVSRRYFSFPIEWNRIGKLGLICFLPLVYGMFFWYRVPLNLLLRLLFFLVASFLLYVFCLTPEEKRGVVGLR